VIQEAEPVPLARYQSSGKIMCLVGGTWTLNLAESINRGGGHTHNVK